MELAVDMHSCRQWTAEFEGTDAVSQPIDHIDWDSTKGKSKAGNRSTDFSLFLFLLDDNVP